MGIAIKILLFVGSFVLMEAIAWTAHKYLMHGVLWFLHKDHHNKQTHGFFERNDFFFLVFAIPGIIALLAGIHEGNSIFFWIGMGITFYGIAYFLVHDVFIHQRFKCFRRSENIYFKVIRRAHKDHHRHLTKEAGECFGMLWVPIKYFRMMKRKSRQ